MIKVVRVQNFIDRESDDGTNYYLRKRKSRIIKFPKN